MSNRSILLILNLYFLINQSFIMKKILLSSFIIIVITFLGISLSDSPKPISEQIKSCIGNEKNKFCVQKDTNNFC